MLRLNSYINTYIFEHKIRSTTKLVLVKAECVLSMLSVKHSAPSANQKKNAHRCDTPCATEGKSRNYSKHRKQGEFTSHAGIVRLL